MSSDSGLPDIEEPWHQVVQLHVILGGRSYEERDPALLTFDLNDSALRPSTSCPSPGQYLLAMREVVGDCVVVLTPHAALSGAFAAANAAALTYRQESSRSVEVVDTRTAGPAYSLVCRVAMNETSEAGEARAVIKSVSAAVQMYGLVSSLAPLLRSGRLGRTLARTVDKVDTRFMFRVSGRRFRPIGFSRDDPTTIDKLVRHATQKATGPVWAVGFSGHSSENAGYCLKILATRIPVVCSWVFVAGPALIVHGGSTMAGFAIAPTSSLDPRGTAPAPIQL